MAKLVSLNLLWFVALSLMLSGEQFLPAARLVFFAHIPVMAIEGVLTAAAASLARKVKPELFHALEVAR